MKKFQNHWIQYTTNPLVDKAKTKNRENSKEKFSFSVKNPKGTQSIIPIIVATITTHFFGNLNVSVIYGLINDPNKEPIERPRRVLLVLIES